MSDDGEGNRILNSDPVLWTFTDDVNGLRVLDAGCGTRATVGERRRRGLGAVVTIAKALSDEKRVRIVAMLDGLGPA